MRTTLSEALLKTAETWAAAVLEASHECPPVNVERIAELLGVTTVSRVSMLQDGRLEKRNDCVRILLRKDVPPTRQRFTLCHELGHLLLEPPKDRWVAQRSRATSSNTEERFCDAFAAALLLPRSWVREKMARRGSRGELSMALEIANEADASLSAVVRRLSDVSGCRQSLLHWRKVDGRWGLCSTFVYQRSLRGRVNGAPESSAILDLLAEANRHVAGRAFPLEVRDSRVAVPAELFFRSPRSASMLVDLSNIADVGVA